MAAPLKIEFELDLSTGKARLVNSEPIGLDSRIRRFDAGPFSAPTPSGPTQPPQQVLTSVPLLAIVLRDPDPPIPAIRDWSFRADEPLDQCPWFSHWIGWEPADQALVDGAIDSEVEAKVVELIDRWTWIWPDVAAQVLPARNPWFVARLEIAYKQDPRYSRKREAHWSAWLDTALHIGLFEHYRYTHRWPDPEARTCATCGRMSAPETLSHWMRSYGPARYCAACCCRAR